MNLEIGNESVALKELRRLLDAQIFSKQKKEICLQFDRKPSQSFFKEVMEAFFDYKSAYLKMIKYEIKPLPSLDRFSVHNGEILNLEKHRIIIGNIHEGGQVNVVGNLVVIGEVKGIITLMNDECSIFASKFINASIHTYFDDKRVVNGKNLLINCENIGGKLWQE